MGWRWGWTRPLGLLRTARATDQCLSVKLDQLAFPSLCVLDAPREIPQIPGTSTVFVVLWTQSRSFHNNNGHLYGVLHDALHRLYVGILKK